MSDSEETKGGQEGNDNVVLHSLFVIGSTYDGVNEECGSSGEEDAYCNPGAVCNFDYAQIAIFVLLNKFAVVVINNLEFAFKGAGDDIGVITEGPVGRDGNFITGVISGGLSCAIVANDSASVIGRNAVFEERLAC